MNAADNVRSCLRKRRRCSRPHVNVKQVQKKFVKQKKMASIGSKREWDVSDIEEGTGVSVHGIPINVSPLKESRKTKGVFYFDAKLTDGKQCVRVVSFDGSHLEPLKKAEKDEAPVALDNSAVKRSSMSAELEVFMSKRSKVAVSPHKLSLGQLQVTTASSKVTKLAELVSLRVNQGIEVVCKVIKVGEVEEVNPLTGTAGYIRLGGVPVFKNSL